MIRETIYLLSKDSSFDSLYLMDEEHIQKSFVVAMDGYMEGPFTKVGIIPNMYLYRDSVPEVFKGSSVEVVQYDGTLAGAIDAVFSKYLTEVVVHMRVLGTDSIKALVDDSRFIELMKMWTAQDNGISLIYDGKVEVASPVFPIWELSVKETELQQVQPSFGKQVLSFGKALLKEAGAFMTNADEVSDEEYLRRWNTCLTCPKLVRDSKKNDQLCCGLCGCPMKNKCRWRSADCGDKGKPKW
jgi:hypothetical protein